MATGRAYSLSPSPTLHPTKPGPQGLYPSLLLTLFPSLLPEGSHKAPTQSYFSLPHHALGLTDLSTLSMVLCQIQCLAAILELNV